MDISDIVKEIGIPIENWEGNCYGIACAIVEHGLVEGKAQYGHWLGPVAPGSMFDRGIPFARHGWVQCNGDMILDPTRWVFEGAEPYIWIGPNDGSYDPGGNVWRKRWERPCPLFDPESKQVSLQFTDLLDRSAIMDLLDNPPAVTIEQAFWLANLSFLTLGLVLAHALYQALDIAGLRALVPIDNWRLAMEE